MGTTQKNIIRNKQPNQFKQIRNKNDLFKKNNKNIWNNPEKEKIEKERKDINEK